MPPIIYAARPPPHAPPPRREHAHFSQPQHLSMRALPPRRPHARGHDQADSFPFSPRFCRRLLYHFRARKRCRAGRRFAASLLSPPTFVAISGAALIFVIASSRLRQSRHRLITIRAVIDDTISAPLRLPHHFHAMLIFIYRHRLTPLLASAHYAHVNTSREARS